MIITCPLLKMKIIDSRIETMAKPYSLSLVPKGGKSNDNRLNFIPNLSTIRPVFAPLNME